MTIEEDLHQFDKVLEDKLIEGERQLRLGKEEALSELYLHRDTLGKRAVESAELLNRFAARAEAEVEEVRNQLGQLNFLLAHGNFRSVEEFETFRNRLLNVMNNAIVGLETIEHEGDEEFETASEDLFVAWEQFHQRLELLRFHLRESELEAEDELAAQRMELAARLEEMRRKGESKPLTGLKAGFQSLWPWVEAFFQNPDIAAPVRPTPPRER